jgi:uncharacterized membrane protein YqiK
MNSLLIGVVLVVVVIGIVVWVFRSGRSSTHTPTMPR